MGTSGGRVCCWARVVLWAGRVAGTKQLPVVRMCAVKCPCITATALACASGEAVWPCQQDQAGVSELLLGHHGPSFVQHGCVPGANVELASIHDL